MLYLVRDRVRVRVRIRVRVRVRVRVRRHCGGMLLLVQVGRSHAEPLDVRRGQVDGVVRPG